MDLQDFIQEVLDCEFSDPQKRKIEEKRDGYRFACPFCGDSLTVASKKRGNIFLNSKAFKCFNDGCMVWMPLKKFVSVMADKHDIDISELEIDFEPEQGGYEKHERIEGNDIMKFLSDTGALGTMLDLEYVRDRFSLIDVRSLHSNSKVRQFMQKRLLYNIPGVGEYIFADNTDSVIFIFNYHKPSGKIISLATRKIEYKKYKVIPYSHICENLHIEPVAEHAGFIDQIGEYFNLLNVDFTKPIKITEGQIDSMFLSNACALQGITKSMFILDWVPNDNVWTMFDRDKGGIGVSVREIMAGRRVFMWSMLMRNLKRKYSPDIPELRKIKDTNDLYVFLHVRTELPIWRFDMLVNEYFTSSKFDMIYL